jgi:hypothetical protein
MQTCSHKKNHRAVSVAAGFQPNHLNYMDPGIVMLSQDDPNYYYGDNHYDIEEEVFPIMHVNTLEIMQRDTPELYDFYTKVKDAQNNDQRLDLGITGYWVFLDVGVSGAENTPFIIVRGIRTSLKDGSWDESTEELYIYNFVGNAMSIYDKNDKNRYFFGIEKTIHFLDQYFCDCGQMKDLNKKRLFQLYSDVTGFHSAADLEFYNSRYWHIWSQNGNALLGHGEIDSGEIYRFTINENEQSQELTLNIVDQNQRMSTFSGNEHHIIDKLNIFFAVGYLNPHLL